MTCANDADSFVESRGGRGGVSGQVGCFAWAESWGDDLSTRPRWSRVPWRERPYRGAGHTTVYQRSRGRRGRRSAIIIHSCGPLVLRGTKQGERTRQLKVDGSRTSPGHVIQSTSSPHAQPSPQYGITCSARYVPIDVACPVASEEILQSLAGSCVRGFRRHFHGAK